MILYGFHWYNNKQTLNVVIISHVIVSHLMASVEWVSEWGLSVSNYKVSALQKAIFRWNDSKIEVNISNSTKFGIFHCDSNVNLPWNWCIWFDFTLIRGVSTSKPFIIYDSFVSVIRQKQLFE